MPRQGVESIYRKAAIALLLISLLMVFTGCIHQIQPSAQTPTDTNDTVAQNNTTEFGNNTVTVSNVTNDTEEEDEEEEEEGPTLYDVRNPSTIRIEGPNGSIDRVKLIGLKAPGVRSAPPKMRDGCWDRTATEAETYLEAVLTNETIELRYDSQVEREGIIAKNAYVYVDGVNINHDMIRKGYSLHAEGEYDMADEFENSSDHAWKNEIGIWGECLREGYEYVPSPRVVITDYDLGPYPSSYSIQQLQRFPNLQFFVLENKGDATAHMGRWAMGPEATSHSQFPTGLTLEPGESVTIYPGDETTGFPFQGRFNETYKADNPAYLGRSIGPYPYDRAINMTIYEDTLGSKIHSYKILDPY